MRALQIAGVAASALFVLLVIGALISGSPEEDAASQAKRKDECARAVTSSMRAPVRTYADKAAYDAVVREKCAGITINGKPVAP